jgi:hypothetical protein
MKRVMRAHLRNLGLGRFLYRSVHRPLGLLRETVKAGGPWQARRTARGCIEMELAAQSLPRPPDCTDSRPVSVHLLTGHRFWFQTAFCLHTLATHARRPVNPVLYDDGSLSDAETGFLTRLFPAVRVVRFSESVAKLDEFLPRSRYPALRDRWEHYPNIRKLIDPHLDSHGWKLVIDSDMLFFSEPRFLLDWNDSPNAPLHAVDIESSYGYSRELVNSLAGSPVAERVNVGLCGLNSSAFDWKQIELWCNTLLEREGKSYYLEQALVAMLVAGNPCSIAPVADYVTLPRPPEALECRAVMHHYVAESKRWYFQFNWRRAIPSPT